MALILKGKNEMKFNLNYILNRESMAATSLVKILNEALNWNKSLLFNQVSGNQTH